MSVSGVLGLYNEPQILSSQGSCEDGKKARVRRPFVSVKCSNVDNCYERVTETEGPEMKCGSQGRGHPQQ